MRALTREEVRLIIRAAIKRCERHTGGTKADAPAYYLALYWTGVRVNELGQLRWENVDLLSKEITIPATVAKSRRQQTIMIHPELMEYLIHISSMNNPQPEDFLFKVVPTRKTLRTDAKAAGVPLTGVGMHSFRKSFATHGKMFGLEDKEIAQQTRHQSLAVLNKSYIDSQMTLEEKISRMPSIMLDSQPNTDDGKDMLVQSPHQNRTPNGSSSIQDLSGLASFSGHEADGVPSVVLNGNTNTSAANKWSRGELNPHPTDDISPLFQGWYDPASDDDGDTDLKDALGTIVNLAARFLRSVLDDSGSQR